jgi:diguanylate cyclase (GGDEF)-like protein/PAS domain S-box-containing protein
MVIVDRLGKMVVLNREVEPLFGWTDAELLGHPMIRLIPVRFHRVFESQSSPPGGSRLSLFARRHDGSEFPVEISRMPLNPGTDGLVLVTIRDLTEWRRAQESLFRENEQAAITLESIGDAVITTDLLENITYLNPVAERLTGWHAVDALGLPASSILTFISDTTREPVESSVTRCLHEGHAVDLPDGVLLLRRDGTEVEIGDSAAPIHDRDGVTTGAVLVFHDVTEKRRVSRKLSHDATHDALTGAINRKEFERRLTRVLADIGDVEGAEHALCYLDLDRFKLVNDAAGHEAGDDVLRQVAALLGTRMRKRDTLARLGGDEFGVLLENCPLAEAEDIADATRRAIEEYRCTWGERTFSLGISIGVIPITASSGRLADVLRAADSACYLAKEAGGNRVHVERSAATPGTLPHIVTRRANRLAQAVKNGDFHLYAQAIVPLVPERTARPRCEILLRLPDERGGLQSAASIVPEAERYNLMPTIDRWVVRRTIELLGRWHRDHPECELPLCSINLSVSSLDDAGLIPALREWLAQHRLPANALCFEITEAVALGNFAQTVRFISGIRAIGCGVALDDFGGGANTFVNLKALPVDFLKIRGHFVRGVVDDPVYGTIVSTVNQVGRLLGITTIAEEVDSEPVVEQLRKLGIPYAQGHALAAPAPLEHPNGELSLPCYQRSA